MTVDPRVVPTDWPNARKALIVLAGIMVLFLFHGVLHLKASTVAFMGFATAFAWARPDPDEILHKIDWSALLFFSTLFVLVCCTLTSLLIAVFFPWYM